MGGALYLVNSVFNINRDGDAIFSDNVATGKGGAIFVLDINCEVATRHGLKPAPCVLDGGTGQGEFIFTNNSAPQGPVLYGGLLDRCDQGDGIAELKEASEYEPTPLAITSDPVRVCLCNENFTVDCSTREITVNKMRGETIELNLATVDQDNNPKTSFIRAEYNELTAQLDKQEAKVETGISCNKLSYHIFTNSTSATLVLRPDGYCQQSDFSTITVHIEVIPCSKGFEVHDDRCGCDTRLTKLLNTNTTTCDVTTDSMQRKGSMWLRYDEDYLKVHTNCPLDYCQGASDTISLAHPDKQCANNRGGVICGACRDNFSIALGSSKCLQCTSSYSLIWLIPLFALAGIALVALLLVCNMTVSNGTLNGLIFYANIISSAGITSHQSCSIHPILSVFIAWVNLDFGVETCFYAGMDTYQKTWLQFAFPLYIWLLVGAILLVCRYSITAVRIFGRNNIAILATLFLLSYTKLLRTIITALSFTQVFQGSVNDTSDQLVPYKVWTYDGNIEYFVSKHAPLFAVALVLLVFLFLPYTLLLTFGQWIRSLPTQRRCVLWCIHSTAFVSIMDAYHAPYNKKHRYWTGLMLLIRCIPFLAFASSYSDNKLLDNMYIITIVLVGVLTLKTFTTKVYKSAFCNILENMFILNLLVLSATLHHLKSNNSPDDIFCKCTTASISLSLIAFLGLLTYHAYLQLIKIKRLESFKNALFAKFRPTKQYVVLPAEEDIAPVTVEPTTTTVQLREELLDTVRNE